MGRWHELKSQFPPSSSEAEAKLKEKSKEATKKKDEKNFQSTFLKIKTHHHRWDYLGVGDSAHENEI